MKVLHVLSNFLYMGVSKQGEVSGFPMILGTRVVPEWYMGQNLHGFTHKRLQGECKMNTAFQLK